MKLSDTMDYGVFAAAVGAELVREYGLNPANIPAAWLSARLFRDYNAGDRNALFAAAGIQHDYRKVSAAMAYHRAARKEA